MSRDGSTKPAMRRRVGNEANAAAEFFRRLIIRRASALWAPSGKDIGRDGELATPSVTFAARVGDGRFGLEVPHLRVELGRKALLVVEDEVGLFVQRAAPVKAERARRRLGTGAAHR